MERDCSAAGTDQVMQWDTLAPGCQHPRGSQVSFSEAIEQREARYFNLLVDALRVSARYKPMFGQGRSGGVTLEQFRITYGADPFYAWVGLDSPLMYAAQKAAGGMTSIYRQLGIGCERIFRAVLQGVLGLKPEQATWTYQVPSSTGTARTLYLDGRIDVSDVPDPAARARV
jgi:hypothetical protein